MQTAPRLVRPESETDNWPKEEYRAGLQSFPIEMISVIHIITVSLYATEIRDHVVSCANSVRLHMRLWTIKTLIVAAIISYGFRTWDEVSDQAGVQSVSGSVTSSVQASETTQRANLGKNTKQTGSSKKLMRSYETRKCVLASALMYYPRSTNQPQGRPGRPRRQDWIVNAERRRGRGAVWSRGAFETVGRACISVGSPLFFPRWALLRSPALNRWASLLTWRNDGPTYKNSLPNGPLLFHDWTADGPCCVNFGVRTRTWARKEFYLLSWTMSRVYIFFLNSKIEYFTSLNSQNQIYNLSIWFFSGFPLFCLCLFWTNI